MTESDLYAIEQLLERWQTLPEDQQQQLIGTMLPPLLKKMRVEDAVPDRPVRFLEDLLAAELRRQHRALG